MSDTATYSPFIAPVKKDNKISWNQMDKMGFFDESEEYIEAKDKDDAQDNSFSAFIKPLEDHVVSQDTLVNEGPAQDEVKDKPHLFPKIGSMPFMEAGVPIAKAGVGAVKETSSAAMDLFKEITGLGQKGEPKESPEKTAEKQKKQAEHQYAIQKGKDLSAEQNQVREIQGIKEENRLGGEEAAFLSKTQKLDKLKLNPNLDRKLSPADMVELRKVLKGEMDEAKRQAESNSITATKKDGFDADMNKINEGGSSMSSIGGNAG